MNIYDKCVELALKNYLIEHDLVTDIISKRDRVDFSDELFIQLEQVTNENKELFEKLILFADSIDLNETYKKLSENHNRLSELDYKIRAKFRI